jgi:hypothetical protein
MSSTYRFRFTIRQWMWVVGILAVCFAAMASEVAGQYELLRVLSYGIAIAAVGVLLYNVRLSSWMWVAIAGFAIPLILGTLVPLASLSIASSLLYVLGLGMTFRDVRRRLEGASGDHHQSASGEP